MVGSSLISLTALIQTNKTKFSFNHKPERTTNDFKNLIIDKMNTYYKFAPNVFLAKCEEQHEKGETIAVTTQHGKENDCIVFNQIGQKDGFYYYSIVRADGFNVQEWAKRKAEKLETAAMNAEKKSNQYYEASNECREFLAMGEPIKVGHHSEKRHRPPIAPYWN